MFNKFIKKSSKFFAVLLTATLAFTPLSYGATPTTFTEFQTFVSDGTYVSDGTITIDNVVAGSDEKNKYAVRQGSVTALNNLTIEKADGKAGTIDAVAANKNAGFEVTEGQNTTINGITFSNFYKDQSWDLDDHQETPTWELTDIGEGAVVKNDGGNLTINNSKFTNNETSKLSTAEDVAFGGAIGHNSTKNEQGTRVGKLTINASTFTANKSEAGGAVFSTGILEIQDSKFYDNSTTMGAGALAMFGHDGEKSIINNTEFSNNETTGFGGAIASGSAADIEITNSQFTGNKVTSGNGGAITNEPIFEEIDYSQAYLAIDGTTFTQNTATGDGGAINNYYYKSKNGETVNNYVSVTNSEFTENQAEKGGAIYNHKYYETHEVGEDEYEPNENPTDAKMLIENAIFTENHAEKGGAIYNEGILTINNSTFEDNTIGTANTKNDIYNVGQISFLSGTTTMTGGILGDGTNGTIIIDGANLILAEGAKLEQQYLTVGTGSALTMDYSGLKIINDEGEGNQIINNGTITFNWTGGEINLNIVGDGEVKYNVDVEQGQTVEIDENNEMDMDKLKGDGEVDNNGIINLNISSGEDYDLKTLKGSGTTNINVDGVTAQEGAVIDLGNKTIQQEINLTGSKSVYLINQLSADSNLVLNNYLTGNSLEITEDFDPSITVNNYQTDPDTQGVVNVMYKGQVNNITNNGAIINVVNVDPEKTDNKPFVVNGLSVEDETDPTYTTDVRSNNFNIGKIDGEESTAGIAVSSKTISYQNVRVSSGILTMSIYNEDTGENDYGKIDNSLITIEENGTLIADAGEISNLRNSDGQEQGEDPEQNDAAIVNDGTFVLVGGTDIDNPSENENNIRNTSNDKGNLVINGIVKNYASVTQNRMTVNESGVLIIDSDNADINTGIVNEGKLVFQTTTTAKTSMVNSNDVTGNGELTINNDLTNEAEILQRKVSIENDATVTNMNLIKSTSVVINVGSTLIAKGEIDTYGDGEFENGKITNNGTFVVNVLTPEGTPDTIPNRNTIDGTGTLRISSTNFNVQENARIDQGSIIVADADSSLSIGVSSVTVSPDGMINNAGKFILTGEGENNNKIHGYNSNYGETIFEEGSNITNNNNIIQSTVTVKGTVYNGVCFIEADLLEIKQNAQLIIDSSDIIGLTTTTTTVKNDGTLTFETSSIDNKNVIEGAGTLEIRQSLINDNTISQSTITLLGTSYKLVNNSSITASYITGSYAEGSNVENNGKLILNLSETAGYGLTNLTGVGTSSITVESGKTVTMNNTGTIEQATIETYGDGTLVLRGNNIVANVVNYMTGNCLDIATRIVGTLDNNPANPDTEGVVNILDGGSISGLITNSTGTINITSTGFEVETGITSNNTSDITKNILNIGSATANIAGVVLSTHTIEYQTITVSSGSLNTIGVDEDGSIKNSSITVATDGLLKVNPEHLINITNPITNNGTVDFFGNTVVNVSTITGTGTLIIDGKVTNQDGTKIKQNQIINNWHLYVNANDIDTTAGTGILNDGTLFFTGGNTVNTSTISTATDLYGYGYLAVTADKVENTAEITQYRVDVYGTSELENNSKITAGEMRLHDDAILDNDGEVVVFETLIVDEGARIENGDASESNEYGTITAEGTLENWGTVQNSSGTINAGLFENHSDAVINNEQYGVIVATNVWNWGTLVSSGSIIVKQDLSNESNGVVENKETGSIEAVRLSNFGTIISSGSINSANILNDSGAVIESYRTNEDSEETYEGGTITSTNTAVNRGIIIANASGVDAEIENENGGIYNITGGTVTKNIKSSNGGTVNIKQSSVTLAEKAFISQNTINLEGTELKLEKETNLRTSDLNIGQGATLNIMNDTVDNVDINSLNVGDGITWNFKFDVDLKAGTSDMLTNTNFASNSTMTITTVNILKDTDKATTTWLTIADSYSYADVTVSTFATTKVKYTLGQNLNITTATVLGITADGYGGLPNAVYDGLNLYFVTGESEEDPNEYVKKWITDEHGVHNTLIADMSINGKNTVLVSSPVADPETGEITPLKGLVTDSYALRFNDNEEAQGLTIKGFEDALTVNVPDGRLEVNNVVFSSNTGTAIIANEGTTVLNGVIFDNTNTATYDVLNNGELLLETSSSTFTKGIVGGGTTTIKGVGIDMGDATLAQGMVEISHVEGSSLTVKVDKLAYLKDGDTEETVTELILNNGDLVLIGSDTAELSTEIDGIGNTVLQSSMTIKSAVSQRNINISTSANITVDDNASISASTITVNSMAIVTTNADNIHTATNGKIESDGYIYFTGGINENIIEGTGNLYIDGDVENSTGTKVTQSIINISEGNSFTANASDLEVTDTNYGIMNSGTLNFNGGENINKISKTGILNINGDFINTANISQSSVNVNKGMTTNDGLVIANEIKVLEGATLITSANDIDTYNAGGQVSNDGDLVFVSENNMENRNLIIGDGNLTIDGNLVNTSTITQTNINILNGTVEHNVKGDGSLPKITAANISVSTSATFVIHSEVVATDKITNDGTVKINVLKPTGEADEVESQNNIIGKGDLIISSTNYKNDGGTISQKTLTIEDKDSSFETDITKFEAYNGITDNGNLIYTGTGISSSTITGTGELTIGTADVTADVVNKEGNEISLSTITVNEGSKFKANASNITTTAGIVNDAEVTFTGGVNTSTITMTNGNGKMFVEGTYFENTAAITQSTITVTNNMFTNVRGSSITASKFNADTTFVTDAFDLKISSITLGTTDSMLKLMDDEGQDDIELASNIDGSGSLIKEGSAIVTLSGENTYTGTTTITDGALRISSSTNISDRDGAIIYMDGGKLIAAGNMELNSDIVGTFSSDGANDVNIEVEDVATATMTANSNIYGSKDLVKTGLGTLNLEMETNGYAGNTIISSGTVRGTTKNINGIVIGSGANDSIVEFYDADGEVTLNEIDTQKFIGTFNKTGASTMTVTNNFKALDANVLSGTFIIDNDADMGGSGNTFEVTNDMTVENAMLKGYGKINVGNLIIGNGATFAPGNSTTTFKLEGTGNIEVQNGGTLDLEFSQLDMDKGNEEQTNDQILANGTATIDSNSKLVLNNTLGKYYVPETFVLVDAASINDFEYDQSGTETSSDEGDYKQITLGSITFKDYDARELRDGYDTRISTRVFVDTDSGALKVELQRNASEYGTTAEFERSHNEQEAANAIDAISTGNEGDITLPLDVMEHFFYYKDPDTGEANIPELKAALNDVAGVIHSNSTMLTFTNAKIEHAYDKIQKRTADLFPCTKLHDKIWAEYYYNTYNVKENENSPKFDTSVNGFLVGFDMISAKQWTFGVMAGYGTSELKQEQDKTTMNDINLGFYGGYESEKWLLKGMLLGGYEQYTTDRTIGFMNRIANSEHNGYNAALDLEAGYKISLNKKDSQAKHKIYLKPYVGVTGSYINNEGFEEKGADSLNLKVEDYSSFAAQARAGIGLNGKVKKFGWYVKAGARQFLTEDYNEIETSLLDFQDQTKMKIRSAELDKFSYGGGLGVDFALSQAWTVFANGLASFADKSNNYYGNVGLMYKFSCVNNEKKTDEDLEKMSAMLNEKMTEDEALKKQLAEKEKELAKKEKELDDAKNREKELQNRIQKYEANVVSAEQAQQMREKTIKTFRLGEKPTFVFGTDQLNKNGKASLKQVATELESYPDAEVLVEGHTDSVGGDEINQKISEQRAATVATTLKKDYGVKNNIAVIGKGKSEPIASNDTEQGRAKNRRVEIVITTND